MTREEWTRLVAANVPAVESYEIPKIVDLILAEQDDGFIPNFWHAANTIRGRLDRCECVRYISERNWYYSPDRAREHIQRNTFVTQVKLRQLVELFRNSANLCRSYSKNAPNQGLTQYWLEQAENWDASADSFESDFLSEDQS